MEMTLSIQEDGKEGSWDYKGNEDVDGTWNVETRFWLRKWLLTLEMRPLTYGHGSPDQWGGVTGHECEVISLCGSGYRCIS